MGLTVKDIENAIEALRSLRDREENATEVWNKTVRHLAANQRKEAQDDAPPDKKRAILYSAKEEEWNTKEMSVLAAEVAAEDRAIEEGYRPQINRTLINGVSQLSAMRAPILRHPHTDAMMSFGEEAEYAVAQLEKLKNHEPISNKDAEFLRDLTRRKKADAGLDVFTWQQQKEKEYTDKLWSNIKSEFAPLAEVLDDHHRYVNAMQEHQVKHYGNQPLSAAATNFSLPDPVPVTAPLLVRRMEKEAANALKDGAGNRTIELPLALKSESRRDEGIRVLEAALAAKERLPSLKLVNGKDWVYGKDEVLLVSVSEKDFERLRTGEARKETARTAETENPVVAPNIPGVMRGQASVRP